MGASEILDFASNNTLQTTVNTYIMPALNNVAAYQAHVAIIPGWSIPVLGLFTITLYQNFNGLLLLPILAGVSQILMTKLNPAMQGSQPTGDQQQNNTMNAFRKWFFPLFSVFICLSSNAGFALYWVTINIFATGQSILINRYLESKEQRIAASQTDGGKGIK